MGMFGTAGSANASNLCINGMCTMCDATTNLCSSGALPPLTEGQIGSCTATSGLCTYSSTCTTNSDCLQSNLCANKAVTVGSTTTQVLTCQPCSNEAVSTTNCTTNGTFATTDVAKDGTCSTSGVCSYNQVCTADSDCTTTNLCVLDTTPGKPTGQRVCSAGCSDNASCMTGTVNADDYEGTCTAGVCSFEETGLSGGAIAGIVIGSVVFVLLVVVGIYFCTKQSGETDTSKAVAYETLHENH